MALKTFGLAVTPKKIENVTKIIAKMALEMGRNRILMRSFSKEEQQNDTSEMPMNKMNFQLQNLSLIEQSRFECLCYKNTIDSQVKESPWYKWPFYR